MTAKIRVVLIGNRWALTREGEDEPLGTYDSQDQADQEGRAQANIDDAEYELCDEDGVVQERDSYAQDPGDVPG
jgi:hypothetical protein